jgi:hypothetical protein
MTTIGHSNPYNGIPKKFHPFILSNESFVSLEESTEDSPIQKTIQAVMPLFCQIEETRKNIEQNTFFNHYSNDVSLLSTSKEKKSKEESFQFAKERTLICSFTDGNSQKDVALRIREREETTLSIKPIPHAVKNEGIEPHVLRIEVNTKIYHLLLHTRKSSTIRDDSTTLMVKKKRGDIPTTEDTHLYRIRKAEKIRKYLKAKGYEEEFVVAKEYLYFDATQKVYYVVGEELPLSLDCVVKPGALEKKNVDESHKRNLSNPLLQARPASPQSVRSIDSADEKPRQFDPKLLYIKELRQDQRATLGAKQIALTLTQAKALAELAIYTGCTDLSYNNLFYTEDHKIAIIDTEPTRRWVKKTFFNRWIRDRGALLAQQAIRGIAQLKLSCSESETFKEVVRIERNHALWTLSKLVTKIALGCLLLALIPQALTALSLGIATMPLQYMLLTAVAYKVTELACAVLGVLRVWKWSSQIQGIEGKEEQDQEAIDKFRAWEEEGVI